MEVASDTAVVLTTHDGERYLERQIESILDQSLLPAVLAIVDDASRDRTRAIIHDIARAAPIPIEIATIDGSRHRDPKTRVAASVMHGLDSVSRFEYAVISDQDDEWLPGRLASQRDLLEQHPDALLIAGDGVLIDGNGVAIGGTLRDRFPPPANWERARVADRVRAAVRRPFVTGAACALRRRLVPLMTPLPPRWLFDRWATLVAASQDGLVLQPDAVIRYRIHPGQLVGISQATRVGGARWREVLARGATPVEAAIRASQVVGRIRPLASDPDVRHELSWGAMVRAAMARTDAST